MKEPITKEEIDSFLVKIQNDINELGARCTRVKNSATIMQHEQTDEHYLNFKAEFDLIIVLLRRLCLGCVDFNPEEEERAKKFLFEEGEGCSCRNAFVVMSARDFWDELVAYFFQQERNEKPLIRILKRFANGYVCHSDPKGESFDDLYGALVRSNGFYTRIEEVTLHVVSAFNAAYYRYKHQNDVSDKHGSCDLS